MELRFREDEWKKAERRAKLEGRSASALLELGKQPYSYEALNLLSQSYLSPLMRKPESFTKTEQFYTPSLSRLVRSLTDKQYESQIPEILSMAAEGQFSQSIVRRSFRTKRLAVFGHRFISLLASLVREYYSADGLIERLSANDPYEVLSTEYLLAYGLRHGDKELKTAVKEAIYGDNSKVRLSNKMIKGVIISGDEELVGELLKLLGAAGLQEGLRQQILEAADRGSFDTFQRIVSFCADNDLFRYSAVLRAFNTWTGLNFDNSRPALYKRLEWLASQVLSDENARKACIESSDPVVLWMGLWGYGCRELDDTEALIERFLDGSDRVKRLFAWYYVFNTDNESYRMRCACRHLDERDPELLAWITNCLAQTDQLRFAFYIEYANKSFRNEDLPAGREERRELFFRLKELLPLIGTKKTVFSDRPLPGVSVTLSADPVVGCLMSLAAYEMDGKLTCEIPALAPYMNSDRKQALIKYFLHPKTSQSDRAVLVSLLDDKSIYIKEAVIKSLKDMELKEEELIMISDSLKSKSSSFREAALSVLRSQPDKSLKPLLHKMLSSGEEFKIRAAVDLISEKKAEAPGILNEFGGELTAIKREKLSTQTVILLNKLLPEEEETKYDRKNGFGLYDPKLTDAWYASVKDKNGSAVLDKKALAAILPSKKEFERLLMTLDSVFDRHADYEYELRNWDDSRTKVLFGSANIYRLAVPAEFGGPYVEEGVTKLDMIPFADEFREALGGYASDPVKLLGLYAVSQSFVSETDLDSIRYASWYAKLFKDEPIPNYLHSRVKDIQEMLGVNIRPSSRRGALSEIIWLVPNELDQHVLFETAFGFYKGFAETIGNERLSERYGKEESMFGSVMWQGRNKHDTAVNCRELGIWRQLIGALELNDNDFSKWFPYELRIEKLVNGCIEEGLSAEDIFRAYRLGLIPREMIFERLLWPSEEPPEIIEYLTGKNRHCACREFYEKYPEAEEIVNTVIDRIADVEEKRGELATELTNHANAVGKLYGSEHFIGLLAALGKESFYRGYDFMRNTDKRAVLSKLLKNCRPKTDDTPEKLKALASKTDITEKRLAEAIMYCPQWAGIAEKALGWEGLKSAVWYFHSHINEDFTAEKETETALYSPISPERFMDGAFDKNWFFDCYKALGEKRFSTLYKSAKYITSGSNNHRRSQLFSDAALGRLDIGSLEAEIADKRNCEKLRAYPLIPINKGDTREPLRRYEFLMSFAKASKQFGAQRRESERKAVDAALENLAVNLGISDVNRLIWRMETEKTAELKPFMKKRPIGEYSAWLTIGEDGEAEVAFEKDGKKLKSVPKSVSKDTYFLELKQCAKELKEQKRRAKKSLERAMTERTDFEANELSVILDNPVLAPMIGKLVWLSDGRLGFIRKEESGLSLVDHNGEVFPAGSRLVIAHPHDMRVKGVWHEFMRLLYEKRVVQPFKQVFREYYPITEDEKAERTLSRRYAGYQVNPKRALALLKGRCWTVDYEEGLQRVFYREDLLVRLYSIADWFSPAEVEAPTLEAIQFFNRRTFEIVPLEEVDPVTFSEIMRDIDLVVSVAYAGGVDPETSKSTIEMRACLAEELAGLLKLSNVRFTENHALISGKLANWSVHMGSGIVHAEGRGMIPVIPVHSQARGRVFLPFADDDPKTAEIMSEIILLSEDGRIRDPEILKLIG